MLSTWEIRAFLDRLSYKPGWEITAHEDPFEGQKVRIIAPGLPDSYRPGETIDLGVESYLPPLENLPELQRWLFWRLRRIEVHEAMEFFKVDGELVWDPHA